MDLTPNAVYAGDSIPRKFGPPETLQVEELYQKGLGHEKFGQIADAEAAYQVALSRDPLFSPVQLRLGLLAMERFQYDKAHLAFREGPRTGSDQRRRPLFSRE